MGTVQVRSISPKLAAVLAAGVAAMVAAAAVRGEPPTLAQPVQNAILITVDTLRADTLGFAGDREVATPILDRLAAAGRVFSSAHAHCVTTLPSHASMLTGLYPYQHRVRHNGGFVLPGDVPTLGALLQGAGFATAAFVGAFPLDARFGLDRGFDVYDDDYDTQASAETDSLFLYSERPGDEVVARGAEWWRAHRGERRFLWLHLFDPHAPYEPPEPFRTRFAEEPYRGEVSAVDAYLRPLLDGFLEGAEEPTLIVFTSDHGEALGEHGEATHGLFAYEPTLRVPLVLFGPGVARGVDERNARHVDLLPTILDALGEPRPEGLPGNSLLAPADQHPDESFFEALSAHLDYGWAPLRGVLRGGEKLIVLPVPELYDLRADPGEKTNVFRQQRRSASALAELLPEESAWPPVAGAVSTEEATRLQSLGYLAGPTVKKERYTAEDDPKNLLELDHKVTLLAGLASRGERAKAIEVGRQILAERPSMGLVYVYLSTLLIQEGKPEQAIEVMRRARSLDLAGHELSRQLGLTLIHTGRAQEALVVLEPLAEDGTDIEAGNHLALALAYLGRYEQASARLKRLLEKDPNQARTQENLSFLAILTERFAEARDHARRAVEIDPDLASSWNNLGIALFQLGSPAEAIDAWKHSLALSPENVDVLLNLGSVAAQGGDHATATETLKRFLELAEGPGYEAKRRQARDLLEQLAAGSDSE